MDLLANFAQPPLITQVCPIVAATRDVEAECAFLKSLFGTNPSNENHFERKFQEIRIRVAVFATRLINDIGDKIGKKPYSDLSDVIGK